MVDDREILNFHNNDLENIVTPIKVEQYKELLEHYNYDKQKTEYLVEGFTNGFDFGYEGPTQRRDTAENIPFSVGDRTEMWNKIMKEVQLKRFAGPFEDVPYDTFIQSPVGLVPKAGNKTRLIFHLSYDFNTGNKLFNFHTREELKTVKYRDLDYVIKTCLRILPRCNNGIFFAKTDVTSAFRLVPGKKQQWRWLLLKAEHPTTIIQNLLFCR